MNEQHEALYWSLTNSRRRDLERLARRHRVKLWDLFDLARMLASLEIDPAPGRGKRFRFCRSDFVTPDYFEQGNGVPAPDDNVDLLEAWDQALEDARVAQKMLSKFDTEAVARSVIRNINTWEHFWSARFWDFDARERFATRVGHVKAEAGDES